MWRLVLHRSVSCAAARVELLSLRARGVKTIREHHMPPTLPPCPSPFWGGGIMIIMASSRARGTRAPVSQDLVRLEGRGEIEHARTPRARGARAHARAESLRRGRRRGRGEKSLRGRAVALVRRNECRPRRSRWCVCGDLSWRRSRASEERRPRPRRQLASLQRRRSSESFA